MKTITVWSAQWCAPCKKAISRLKNKGIEFHTMDIDDNYMQAREKAIMSIPTIEVSDETGTTYWTNVTDFLDSIK